MIEHWKNLSLEPIVEEYEGVVYTEEWRPTYIYGDRYLVSSFGRVKSLFYRKRKAHGILKQSPQPSGYLFVSLQFCGFHSLCTIHRLVAIAFIPNPESKREVNHLFGNKKDNRKWTLEWNTTSENGKHAYRIGLRSREDCRKSMLGNYGALHHNSKKVNQYDLNGTLLAQFHGTREAARLTGCCQTSIGKAASGAWKSAIHKGFKWEYA